MRKALLEPNRVSHLNAGDIKPARSRKAATAKVPKHLCPAGSEIHRPAPCPGIGTAHLVEFQLSSPAAEKVCVAGAFNGWNPEECPLARNSFGTWITHLMLSPGSYEYRYVVDGCWQEDPNAGRQIPNPFGGSNSVVEVGVSASAPSSAMQVIGTNAYV